MGIVLSIKVLPSITATAPAALSDAPSSQGLSSSSSTPTSLTDRAGLTDALRKAVVPLSGKASDYDALMQMVGQSRFVLLGEATHGTHEFYRERARITRRLIEEKGFSAVVIEGDWPDAFRVNRYVRGLNTNNRNNSTAKSNSPQSVSVEQALAGFTRFPRWMWRNSEVRDLVQWLRQYNTNLPTTTPRVGFYGMDLYSLPGSTDAVVQYLEGTNREAAHRARQRYRSFASFRNEPERYGLAALSDPNSSGEQAARAQWQEMQQLHGRQEAAKGTPANEELFSALQNARVVQNAEEYYRTMYAGGVSSWNLRDRHMADTVEALAAHLSAPGRPAKIVIWAHNSHVGDARHTTMGESGEWTLGQLMRQRQPEQTVLIGFTTYTGTVMAASEWGHEGKIERVRPSLPGSFGALFHETGVGNFLLPLQGSSELILAMGEPRLERAIGVIYLPQTERESHYFQARMSKQFDAVIHYDTTRAVQALAR